MNAPSVIGANAYAQVPPANHIALIREFIIANPKIFVFYVLFLLVLPLQDVGMPHLYGKIVQQIQNKQAYGKTFVWVVSIIVIIQMINSMLDFEEMRFQPKMVEFIHTRIIRHLFGEYSTSLDDLKTGELFSKMIKLPFALYDYLEIWRYFILPQLLVYTITGFYLYSKDPAIGVMFGVMMSVVAFMIFTIPNMCKRVSMLRDENFNQLNERIDEMLKNMPAILNAGTYEKEEAVLRGFQAQYSEYTKKSMMCMIYCKMVFIVVYLAFILFFFWRCYTQIKAGRMEAGSFVALFTIMMYTTNSMWKIVYQIKDVIFRIGTIKESMKVFDRLEKPEQRMPDAATSPTGGGAAAEGTGALRMTNVTFKYPKIADAVIEKMNLTVRRGERVLLVGRIGSGKSTVLKLLMKYHLPHEGTIYLDGTPYAAISEEALRARIGYVPQTPILFDRTVYENINYGAREVSRAEILALVETLRMEDTFAKFKEGLDTEVGKNGGRISGGQRQILWLFRVILQNPEVVLLDEPTASIDAETKEAVQRLLEYAMKGRTVVGVTHDPFLHKHATRIVTMDNGKIIKDSASEAQAGWGRDRA